MGFQPGSRIADRHVSEEDAVKAVAQINAATNDESKTG